MHTVFVTVFAVSQKAVDEQLRMTLLIERPKTLEYF